MHQWHCNFDWCQLMLLIGLPKCLSMPNVALVKRCNCEFVTKDLNLTRKEKVHVYCLSKEVIIANLIKIHSRQGRVKIGSILQNVWNCFAFPFASKLILNHAFFRWLTKLDELLQPHSGSIQLAAHTGLNKMRWEDLPLFCGCSRLCVSPPHLVCLHPNLLKS